MLHNFMDLIRGSFEQGHGETCNVFSGLGVMGEGSPIAEGVQKIFGLVHKGL